MKTNEDEILSEIEYIFSTYKDEEYKKSIFIDGSWGIGKTYFFKNTLAAKLQKIGYSVIYISLFGVYNIKDLHETIKSKLQKTGISEDKKELCKKTLPKIWKDWKKLPGQIKNTYETFNIDGLLSIPIDVYLETIKKNVVFCFDDYERAIGEQFFSEFLGFLDHISQYPPISCLVIGNTRHTAILQDTYKEKVFNRYFTLTKSADDAVKILLDNCNLSEKIKSEYCTTIKYIFEHNDIHTDKLSEKEQEVYEKSKDVFTNIRVIKKITEGIERAEKCIKNKNISREGIAYCIRSFFFFGFIGNSAIKMEDYDNYTNIYGYVSLGKSDEAKAQYAQLVAERVNDEFIKFKSAYTYFKEGYLDEKELKNDIDKYQVSDLIKYLENNIGINSFVSVLLMNDEEIKNKREEITRYLQGNQSPIPMPYVNTLLQIMAQTSLLTHIKYDDESDIKAIVEHMSYDKTDMLMDDFFMIRYGDDSCPYMKQYDDKMIYLKEKLKRLIEEKEMQSRKEKLQKGIEDEDIDYIIKLINIKPKLQEDELLNIVNMIINRLQKSPKGIYGIQELCSNKEFREKFIERLDNDQPSMNLRPEFCEWIKFILCR